MYVIWVVVGGIVGAVVGQGIEGAVAGIAIGLLWARLSQVREDLDRTRSRLDELSASLAPGVSRSDASPVPGVPRDDTSLRTATGTPPETVASTGFQQPPPMPAQASVATEAAPWPTATQRSDESVASAPLAPLGASHGPGAAVPFGASQGPKVPLGVSSGSVPPPPPTTPTAPPPPPRTPTAPTTPPPPSIGERLADTVKRWFTEGNVPVKIGMLVLFAGVAAFLKYAADQGLLRVPVSIRLALVSLAAIGGIAFGWRQRDTRRSFALALQGGALGVLVMTVFAAYRLYGLLPASATFALLIVFVAGLGVLAVVQDALALAVLGLIAGFAAPIIASTGEGNHVALFSYYAILNLTILGIAWKRAWRVLNVLGFVATFGVGTAWGVLKYSPSLFDSTEPFLVLHFLLYLIVPWLHVLRSPRRDRAILDGCLMFGNPIASLLLQGALLDWAPMPLAISAMIAAVIYIGIAFAIRQRDDMVLLRETWAVLAVAFATLAVPLALSASLTASIFALEGAGLIWLGFRQARRLPRWAGVGLQLFAAAAWFLAHAFGYRAPDVPILNAPFVGAMLLVVGAAVGAWQFDRHGKSQGVSSLARIGLALWALLWWGTTVAYEVDRFVDGEAPTMAWWLALVGVTALALGLLSRRVRKIDLGAVLAFGVPAGFVAILLIVVYAGGARVQPLAGWPLAGIAIAGIAGWFSLRSIDAHRVLAVASAAAWWWRWVAVVTVALVVALSDATVIGSGWKSLAYASATLALAALALWWPRIVAVPLAVHASAIRSVVGTTALAGSLLIGLVALGDGGNARPLPFVPVLNPVDLLLIAVLALLARAIVDEAVPPRLRATRPAMIAVAFFVIATSMTLRAVHQLGDIPWDSRMTDSSLAQLSLTIVWSVIGVLAWVLGSRRGQRLLWMAGAGTMALVLAKLLLVDRGHLGNLFGIASFMAYGLLCTVVGYLAPAPPRQPTDLPPESSHAS